MCVLVQNVYVHTLYSARAKKKVLVKWARREISLGVVLLKSIEGSCQPVQLVHLHQPSPPSRG